MLKYIYNKFVKPSQVKIRCEIINRLDVKSILDVGAGDGNLFEDLKQPIRYMGIDIEPQSYRVYPIDVLEFNPKRKFDLVCAFAVLEHTLDPVKVIKKLKELSNKYIMISVPYEPYYTMSRFFVQEKEHYWTIYSNLLKHYLGEPIYERYIHFGREYTALYEI